MMRFWVLFGIRSIDLGVNFASLHVTTYRYDHDGSQETTLLDLAL